MVHSPKKRKVRLTCLFSGCKLAEAPGPGKLFVESNFEAALLQNFEDEGLSMKAGGNVDFWPKHEVHFGYARKRFIHSTARSH